MVETILPFELKNVIVRKRGKNIIGPLSWNSGDTGVTIVMGPNGSGKTTLLRTMHGLDRPLEGSVHWNCETALAQKHQAFVFQSPIMLRRTALENITYPLRLHGKTKPEATNAAREWLERIGLAKVANLGATYLSGGERQKLALARALACEPQVLFLDEPTSNLDGVATREIETLLRDAIAAGLRIVMATHDIGQAKRLASSVLFLYKGRLHEFGPASNFFAKPETTEAQAYLKGDIVE